MQELTIEPVGHRVIVKCTLEQTSKGGIVLAHDEKYARAAMEVGELVAIGPQAWKEFGDGTPWANLGDKVFFSRYGGKIINVDAVGMKLGDGEVLMILNDEDVLGKVK